MKQNDEMFQELVEVLMEQPGCWVSIQEININLGEPLQSPMEIQAAAKGFPTEQLARAYGLQYGEYSTYGPCLRYVGVGCMSIVPDRIAMPESEDGKLLHYIRTCPGLTKQDITNLGFFGTKILGISVFRRSQFDATISRLLEREFINSISKEVGGRPQTVFFPRNITIPATGDYPRDTKVSELYASMDTPFYSMACGLDKPAAPTPTQPTKESTISVLVDVYEEGSQDTREQVTSLLFDYHTTTPADLSNMTTEEAEKQAVFHATMASATRSFIEANLQLEEAKEQHAQTVDAIAIVMNKAIAALKE